MAKPRMKYHFEPSRPGDEILIIGRGLWSKGLTYEEARKNYPFTLKEHHIYSCHPETRVDGDGYVLFPRGHDIIKLATFT